MSKELLNTENQVVYKGLDEKTIKVMEIHLSNHNERIFVIYATAREYLDYGLDKLPKSSYLVLFECTDNTTDEFIIERQQRLEEPTELLTVAGITRGKLNQNKDE